MSRLILSLGLGLALVGSCGVGACAMPSQPTQQVLAADVKWVDYGDPNNGGRPFATFTEAIPYRDAYRRMGYASNIIDAPGGYKVRVFYGN